MKLIWLKLSDFEWWHQVWDLHQFSAMAQQGHFVGAEMIPVCVTEALCHLCWGDKQHFCSQQELGTDK